MTVTATLQALLAKQVKAGTSYYAISQATGISHQVVMRFITGERDQIRSETINRLAEYLGLELRPAAKSSRQKV